jgi:membrane-bound lytic murein transglycosylase B
MNFKRVFVFCLVLTLFSVNTFGFGFLRDGFIKVSYAQTPEQADQEAKWRAELEQTEKDIAKWQDILNNTKRGTASLQKEADILNAKINQAKAFIKARNISIEKLRKEIDRKNKVIESLEDKISNSRDSLADILKKANEIDSYSLAEALLTNKNISDFWSSLDQYSVVNRSLNDLLDQIRQTKDLTEKEKSLLDQKKNKEIDLKEETEVQKQQVEKNEKEKQYLISVNKTQEKTYEQVIKERQKRASEIRAALFSLRDAAAIPFGDAYQYALKAQKITGVRPAFLLAILTQETNLGKNLGTCNKPDSSENRKWKAIMPGPDDIKAGLSKRDDESAYLRITSALGFDPDKMPLSCPIGAGWGGAMGPSQFIPTTWEAYAPRVQSATGRSTANPWNPEDAFIASALYLADLGAGAQTFTSERTAALKYYAGSNWNKKSNAFYGDQVMAKAKNIQLNMIDPLNF